MQTSGAPGRAALSRPKHQLEPLIEAVARLLPATTESQILILWAHSPPRPSTRLELAQLAIVAAFPLLWLLDLIVGRRIEPTIDFLLYVVLSIVLAACYYALVELGMASFRPRPLRGQYEIEIHRRLETVKIVDHLANRHTIVMRFADLSDLVITGVPLEGERLQLEVQCEIGEHLLLLDDHPRLPLTADHLRPDPDVVFVRRLLAISEWTGRPLRLCMENEPIGMRVCSPAMPGNTR